VSNAVNSTLQFGYGFFDCILFSCLRCLRSTLPIFCFFLRLLRFRPVDLPIAPPALTGEGQLSPQTGAIARHKVG
jgi:hypothetical protein